MDKALYTAMTGAKHNMLNQALRANNLANASTDGFRADFAQARSMPIYYGDGSPTRAFALTENPATDFRHGALNATGRELDVALNGDGFFAVQNAQGEEVYTRLGDFQVDANGFLLTSAGNSVIGNGGPIQIPDYEKIDIGLDGTITVIVQGQGPQEPAEVDRIKLVNPNIEDIQKRKDGYFQRKDGEPEDAIAELSVVSGFLEASNVNPIGEFTEMLSLSRQYDMQVKMMNTVKKNSEASAQLLKLS